VYRSVRFGGETKTRKSRRRLALPQLAAEALREHRKRQREARLAAGPLWQDNDLVFCREDGASLSDQTVRNAFKGITEKAGLGRNWAPRELRTSFASILSANDMAIEEISRLMGHSSTKTTETVYRKELRPALTRGAEVMDGIFAGK
jgi:site-specific recombinase XerD